MKWLGKTGGVSSVECCWYLSCEGLCIRNLLELCVWLWKLCVGAVISHLCSSSCFLVTINTLLNVWDKPDKVWAKIGLGLLFLFGVDFLAALLEDCSWKLPVVVECCSKRVWWAESKQRRLSGHQDQGQGLQPPRYNGNGLCCTEHPLPRCHPYNSCVGSLRLCFGNWSYKLVMILNQFWLQHGFRPRFGLCVCSALAGHCVTDENTSLFTRAMSSLLSGSADNVLNNRLPRFCAAGMSSEYWGDSNTGGAGSPPIFLHTDDVGCMQGVWGGFNVAGFLWLVQLSPGASGTGIAGCSGRFCRMPGTGRLPALSPGNLVPNRPGCFTDSWLEPAAECAGRVRVVLGANCRSRNPGV